MLERTQIFHMKMRMHTTVYSEDGAGEGYTGTASKSIQGIASIIQKKGYPNIDEGLHDLIDEFAKEKSEE